MLGRDINNPIQEVSDMQYRDANCHACDAHDLLSISIFTIIDVRYHKVPTTLSVVVKEFLCDLLL